TTTRSGLVTPSWRRIGRSAIRVNARSGAPRRSGPYSGNAWTLLPVCSSASARTCAAVFAPWPARACQRISVMADEELVDGCCGELPLAHRLDGALPAVQHVAAREDPRIDRAASRRVDVLEELRIFGPRALAECLHNRVRVEHELG